jgi:hypothetical protein
MPKWGRFRVVLVLLAAGGLVWFGIAGREGRFSQPTPKGTKEATIAVRSSAAKRKRVSRAGDVPKADRNRILTLEEFKRRFHLTGVEAEDYWSEMVKLGRDLMEQKSSEAQVVEFDGKILKMFIPPLAAPRREELELVVLGHLRKALGDEKAEKIFADSAGKEMLLKRAWYDELMCSVIYTFTKVRNENDPARNGALGDATFDLDVVYDPGDSGAVLYDQSDYITVLGFSYRQAGINGFGWNALAKAPAGFFRSEPILGVASRPPPSVFVIEDLDKNSVEVRNRLYPGSKETHQFGDPPGGDVKRADGK